MIEVVIGTHIWLRGIDRDQAKVFREENTFANPEWHKKKAMGLWIGETPRYITLWRERDGDGSFWLQLPRGYIGELKEHLRGQKVKVEDRTVAPELAAIPRIHGTLERYQADGMALMFGRRSGVLQAPTGSGKTNILMSMIPELGVRTLIVVHSKALLVQTQEAVHGWLGIDAGNWGGGRKKRLSDVTVATVQTLVRPGAVTREDGQFFGALMIDECHHAPARTWTDVCGQFAARYRYGFTATPTRKDGLTMLLWRVVGPKLAEISRSSVLAAGRVVRVKRVRVETGWNYTMTEGTREWGTMLSALAVDERRNQIVLAEILKWAEAGRVIVLTDRISQAEALGELLGDRAVMIHGKLGIKERRSRMAKVKEGARITVGTLQLFGEGVDVPGWDVLVMASPVSWGTRDKQAVGRVMRASQGKAHAVVVRFKDQIEWPEDEDDNNNQAEYL